MRRTQHRQIAYHGIAAESLIVRVGNGSSPSGGSQIIEFQDGRSAIIAYPSLAIRDARSGTVGVLYLSAQVPREESLDGGHAILGGIIMGGTGHVIHKRRGRNEGGCLAHRPPQQTGMPGIGPCAVSQCGKHLRGRSGGISGLESDNERGTVGVLPIVTVGTKREAAPVDVTVIGRGRLGITPQIEVKVAEHHIYRDEHLARLQPVHRAIVQRPDPDMRCKVVNEQGGQLVQVLLRMFLKRTFQVEHRLFHPAHRPGGQSQLPVSPRPERLNGHIFGHHHTVFIEHDGCVHTGEGVIAIVDDIVIVTERGILVVRRHAEVGNLLNVHIRVRSSRHQVAAQLAQQHVTVAQALHLGEDAESRIKGIVRRVQPVAVLEHHGGGIGLHHVRAGRESRHAGAYGPHGFHIVIESCLHVSVSLFCITNSVSPQSGTSGTAA